MIYPETEYKIKQMLLGEYFLKKNIVSSHDLDEALEVQREQDILIGEVLVNRGIIQEGDLVEALMEQKGFPYLKLDNFRIELKVIQLVPKNISEDYCLMPIDQQGDLLIVAMANPLDKYAKEALSRVTGKNVVAFISRKKEIRDAIVYWYQ